LTTDFLKVTENGKTVPRENTKRVSFLEFRELPQRTAQPLELALYLVDKECRRPRAPRASRLADSSFHGSDEQP
jgi:hypothetical protein